MEWTCRQIRGDPTLTQVEEVTITWTRWPLPGEGVGFYVGKGMDVVRGFGASHGGLFLRAIHFLPDHTGL